MNLDYIYIVLPLLIGFITSFFCRPNKNKMNVSKVKLPNEIFIIIWPILYLLLGYCWYLSRQNVSCYIMFWIINILLSTWLIMYSCVKNKNIAYLILILCLLFSILIYNCLFSKLQKYLISPLIVWLIIALIISY